MSERRSVVAVFNSSEDTTDLLRFVLQHAGFVVVTAFTNQLRDSKVDLTTFVHEHRPDVILYDIALPYDHNWALFEHVRDSPPCRGIPFVLTTTNLAQVRAFAGPGESVLEIVGKPYDLEQIVSAVRAAFRGGD